jgi:polysaccharide deacetylase 2 family uncharacterized protein YibQ
MRWKWLAGVFLLVALGAGLWFFVNGAGKPGASVRVAVPMPPLASTPALLLPAPDPGLVANSPDGPLPIIGKDGRQVWQVYARPFDRIEKRPRVALVITGLGLDHALSQAAMDRLPGAVTLAFDPYADDLKNAFNEARSLGHETLLGLPMEPLDFPRQDPGPLTLLASLPENQNIARLNRLMGSGSGYVGFVALWGGRFMADKRAPLPILETLRERGLMLVDNRSPTENATAMLAGQIKLPWAGADLALDADAEPAAIDQAFAALETQAQRNGAALALAALSPALVDHAASWVGTLDSKGIALAPASAVANRQPTSPATAP